MNSSLTDSDPTFKSDGWDKPFYSFRDGAFCTDPAQPYSQVATICFILAPYSLSPP